jgi:putative aldouronate transport system substrate-binding protein
METLIISRKYTKKGSFLMENSFFKDFILYFMMVVFGFGVGIVPSNTYPNSPNPAAISEGVNSKPEVITAMLDTVVSSENGQDKLVEEYKKQTGINLNIINPANNYKDKLMLMIAAGDMPDVMQIDENYLNMFAQNGVLYDITKLVAESSVLKRLDNKYLDAIKVNGKLYAYPTNSNGGTVTYIRKDWLDNNNLTIPTNFDEFKKVLKVFSDDPDKNGKHDTIGLTAPGFITADPLGMSDLYLRQFYQDASPDFIKVDGKWVDGMSQPEMRTALQRMKDAYSEGLIDREAAVNKVSNCITKFESGKVGVFNYFAGSPSVNMENNLKKSLKDASLIAIPSIKEAGYIEKNPKVIAISSTCKNPEGVFKYFIENIFDGDKGEMLWTNGVENVHYKVTDGQYKKLPMLSDSNKTFDFTFIDSNFAIDGFKNPFKVDERITDSIKLLKDNSIMRPSFPLASSSSARDVFILKQEIITKIVMGVLSIEDGLEIYKKNNSSKIDDILESIN